MTTVYNKNGIEFDIDALATDLNNKADTDLTNVSSSVSVCIESWHEGTEWYRVYSDGWCEQGGRITSPSGDGFLSVVFHKEFINRDYYFNRCNYSNVNTVATNFAAEGLNTKANDSVSVHYNSNYFPGFEWEAKGYIR